MLFLAIILFTVHLAILVRRGLFKDTLVKVVEIEKSYKKIEETCLDEEEKKKKKRSCNEEMLKEGCSFMIFGFTFQILEFIFLIASLRIDPYIIPTIFIILITIFKIVIKNDDSKQGEIGNKDNIMKRKPSVKWYINQLIHIIYFAYMFCVLVF